VPRALPGIFSGPAKGAETCKLQHCRCTVVLL
jgi:hypothetical protein